MKLAAYYTKNRSGGNAKSTAYFTSADALCDYAMQFKDSTAWKLGMPAEFIDRFKGAGAYFTLRAGGKTLRTFLFDSVSLWVVSVPVAFILSRFTSLPAVWIYFFVVVANCFKVVLGFIWVKKGIWIVDLVMKKAGDA